MTSAPRSTVAAVTAVGPRAANQDRSFTARDPADGAWVIAVADGVSGNPDGDLAAAAAVAGVPQRIASIEAMRQTFADADDAVVDLADWPGMSKGSPEMCPMATLCVAAWTPDGGLIVGRMGDTLTTLVTWTGTGVVGHLLSDELRRSPRGVSPVWLGSGMSLRHCNYVGLEVVTSHDPPAPWAVVIASDGAWEPLLGGREQARNAPITTLAARFAAICDPPYGPAPRIAERVLGLAADAGLDDNATVAVAHMAPSPATDSAALPILHRGDPRLTPEDRAALLEIATGDELLHALDATGDTIHGYHHAPLTEPPAEPPPPPRPPTSRSSAPRNVHLVTEILTTLTGRLEEHQGAVVEAELRRDDGTTMLMVRLTSGLCADALLAVWVHERIDPRRIAQLVSEAEEYADTFTPPAAVVIASAFLPVRARQILGDLQTGYIDTTGNVIVRDVPPPGAASGAGAVHDPWAPSRGIELRTLSRRATGRCLRALLDGPPPTTIAALAAAAGASPRTAGRVLAYLADQGALDRPARGDIAANLDAASVLALWAVDYRQMGTNRPCWFTAPGIIEDIAALLRATTAPYAVTGALAAWYYRTILPVDWVTVYVPDAAAATTWGLQEPDPAGNMLLLEPYDPVVFERTVDCYGIRCVAPAQLAIDLLTGPGREPSQADYLIDAIADHPGWPPVAAT